jgi:hypothetical protein
MTKEDQDYATVQLILNNCIKSLNATEDVNRYPEFVLSREFRLLFWLLLTLERQQMAIDLYYIILFVNTRSPNPIRRAELDSACQLLGTNPTP